MFIFVFYTLRKNLKRKNSNGENFFLNFHIKNCNLVSIKTKFIEKVLSKGAYGTEFAFKV